MSNKREKRNCSVKKAKIYANTTIKKYGIPKNVL